MNLFYGKIPDNGIAKANQEDVDGKCECDDCSHQNLSILK